MIDDQHEYHDYGDDSQNRTFRWIVFAIASVLGIIVVTWALFFSPIEAVLVNVIVLVPMLVFLLYATLRWAQGKPIVTTDIQEDREIFATMESHALPAERAPGLEMYRCPDCGMSFELVNATPVPGSDSVVLCPVCRARLFIG